MTPLDDIANIIRNALKGAIQDAEPAISKAVGDGASSAAPALEQGVFGGGFNLSELLLLIPGVGEILTLPGNALTHMLNKSGRFVAGVASGWALGEFFSEALRPVWMEATHAINDAIQSEIFDAQTAAELESKGIITNAYGRSEAAGNNLSGEHYDKLVKAAREMPGIATLLDGLNKKVLTDQQVDEALAHHAVPVDYWPAVKALRRNFLNVADLALASLRENLTPETAKAYADQLGMTPEDFQVLIDNTGEPPGPQELMQALRRGFIDQQRFEHGIRQSRVRNEWIDVEHKLAHAPMSTAEAVRAVVENYITKDEGAVIAEHNGLEPSHWPILVESWGRPLAHGQMMELYHRGQATLDEVRQAMRESDIKNTYIEKSIELGRRLVPERTVVSMLHHGVIGHDRAMEMLRHLGFNDVDADSLIKLGGASLANTHKHLNRADIVAMYEDSLLTQRQAAAHLVEIGYTTADAETVLKLADIKVKAQALKATQRGIEASLHAHHLTEQQAINQLERAGVDPARARALVDQWTQQRGTATKSLTEAQVIRLAVHQVVTPQDALLRLESLGLSQQDARLLLAAYNVTA